MGICLEVTPEGEDENPVEWRSDWKDLADLFSWLTWEDSTLPRLGLPPPVLATLVAIRDSLRVDDEFESLEAMYFESAHFRLVGQWLHWALSRVEVDLVLRAGFPQPQANLPAGDLKWRIERCAATLVDWIRVCDWAVANGRRVHLVAF